MVEIERFQSFLPGVTYTQTLAKEDMCLLNRRQREFRKDIREIEQTRRAVGESEPLSYRDARYRPRGYRKPLFIGTGGIGLVGLMILLWNTFAAWTWIHPIHAPNPATSATSSAISTEQQQVNQYIQFTESTGSQLTALIDPYLNPAAVGAMSSQSFAATSRQLTSLQQAAQTSLPFLAPLQSYNLQEVSLIRKTLADVLIYRGSQTQTAWATVQSDVSQYDSNMASRQSSVISVLQNAKMPYQVNASGRITYRFGGGTQP